MKGALPLILVCWPQIIIISFILMITGVFTSNTTVLYGQELVKFVRLEIFEGEIPRAKQEDVKGCIENEGLEWLANFNTKKKLFANIIPWEKKAHNSLRAKLDIAIIQILDNDPRGKVLFREYYDEIEVESHKEWVRELGDRLGIEL